MRTLLTNKGYKGALYFFIFFLSSVQSFATNANSEPSIELVKERVLGLNTCIEKRYTPEVQKRINHLTRGTNATPIILGRISVYFPIFENIFREKGLPDDLKYLAVLESGLSPHATSSVGAAGLWQFMKPTGRMQGLKINSVVDERRNIVKSTYAAADYLQYLHGKFGDWTLAIAAYNCGPGNVRKAIKRSGGKTTFWEIQKYLPKQTRQYVPKYLAYVYVMSYYHEYGITANMPSDKLIYTVSAKINEKTHLKTVSKNLGLDYKTVKTLNAQYIKGYIPKNDGRYLITLPEQEMYTFANDKNLELLYPPMARKPVVEQKVNPIVQTVTVKKTQQQKISVAKINRISNRNIRQTNVLNVVSNKNNRPYKYYSIKRKESLSDIALRENIEIEELIKLNNISRSNPPKMGDIIKIYISAS